MLLCLAGLVALRIRSSYREQASYQEAVKEVRLATRAASRAPEELWRERSLDQLVSRIATTYSHEFRNPLGAALATNLSMARQRWSPAASAAIYSMRRAIMQISEARATFRRLPSSPVARIALTCASPHAARNALISSYRACQSPDST